MNSCLSDCEEFLKIELKTIQYLKTKCSNKNLISLSEEAVRCYSSLKSFKGLDVCFEWIVLSKEHDKIFIINVAGLVSQNSGKISNVSYCLSVSEKENDSIKVIRKFHFDYTDPESKRRLDHPIFHIQFPGELLPHWKGRNYVDAHLYPELSEPRILFKPMSLALVLHIAFIEFPDIDFQGIVTDSTWVNIIKDNQEFVWKPYWQKCLYHIQRNELLFDVGYAKKNI